MEASPHTDRPAVTAADDLPYTLGARLGGSGGTEVWVAHPAGGTEPVALKLMRDADRAPLDSFRHELEAARALDHPALVRVRDFGESSRGFYVAMDLVQPGISLAVLIARQRERRMPLSSALVAYIGISVAEALDHAATRAKLDGLSVRLVHRHVSPHNIMIDTEGRVRVVDLAVPASRAAISPISGMLVRGTPGYLAPEQVKSGSVDERSDVFALGTILHECATLEPVFARVDPTAAMRAVLEREVPALADALSAFPQILSRTIARAMAAEPSDRPADTGELKVALREAVPTTPGYTDARVALSTLVIAALRAINQESEARTALIDEGADGPRTLQVDAPGVDPPGPDAVHSISLASVKALADAELSEDSRNSDDEPTGALLMPPPMRSSPHVPTPRVEETPAADGLSGGSASNDVSISDAVEWPPAAPRARGRSSEPPPVRGRSLEPPPPVRGRVSESPPVRGRVSEPPPVRGRVSESPAARGRVSEPPPGIARGAEPIPVTRPSSEAPAGPPPLVTPRTPTAPTPNLAPISVPIIRRASGSVTPRTPTRPTADGRDEGWLEGLSATLEDPARRTPIVAVFIIVLVILIAVLVTVRTAPPYDDALRALYAKGDYAAAEAYFVEHSGDFKNPGPAFELAADAWRRARASTLVPLPGPTAAPRVPARPVTTATVAPVSAAVGLAAIAIPDDIPETPARTKPDRKARSRARKSREAGLRALEQGDLVLAEKHLRRCVATFDGPACRLHLGLLHARAGELEEASIHFERYLQAWPEAPDAAAIRAALAALPDVE